MKYKVELKLSCVLFKEDIEEIFEHLIDEGKYSLEYILQVLDRGYVDSKEHEDIYFLLEEDCYNHTEEVKLTVIKYDQ